MNKNNPQSFLRDVADIIDERGKTHGHWRENMEVTAKMWSLFLGHYLSRPITAEQAAVMMGLLKVSRMACRSVTEEHCEDFVGYGGLAGGLLRVKNQESLET